MFEGRTIQIQHLLALKRPSTRYQFLEVEPKIKSSWTDRSWEHSWTGLLLQKKKKKLFYMSRFLWNILKHSHRWGISLNLSLRGLSYYQWRPQPKHNHSSRMCNFGILKKMFSQEYKKMSRPTVCQPGNSGLRKQDINWKTALLVSTYEEQIFENSRVF